MEKYRQEMLKLTNGEDKEPIYVNPLHITHSYEGSMMIGGYSDRKSIKTTVIYMVSGERLSVREDLEFAYI